MPDTVQELHGARLLICDAEGPSLAREGDIGDFIPKAWEAEAEWLVLPVNRLGDNFFNLRTRLAGEVIQKFVNYRLRLVVLGDISHRVAQSEALRDFVTESNRGRHVWFVDNLAALEARLAGI